MEHVNSGQKLAIPAATFNCMVDAAKDFKARQSRQGGGDQVFTTLDPVTVLLTNPDSVSFPRFHAAAIGEPAIPPDDQLSGGGMGSFFDAPNFEAALPAGTLTEKIAIIDEPIGTGDVETLNRAIISGCAVCRIKVNNESEQYARTVKDDTFLETAGAGQFRILWKEAEDAEDGLRWAYGIVNCAPSRGARRFEVVDVSDDEGYKIAIIDGNDPESGVAGWLYYKALSFVVDSVDTKTVTDDISVALCVSENSGTAPRYTPEWQYLETGDGLPTDGFGQIIAEVTIDTVNEKLVIKQLVFEDVVAPDTWQQYGVKSEFMLEWNYRADTEDYRLKVNAGQVIITGLSAMSAPSTGLAYLPVSALETTAAATTYFYLKVVERYTATIVETDNLADATTKVTDEFRKLLWSVEFDTRDGILFPVISRHFAGPVIVSDINPFAIPGYLAATQQTLTQYNGVWQWKKYCPCDDSPSSSGSIVPGGLAGFNGYFTVKPVGAMTVSVVDGYSDSEDICGYVRLTDGMHAVPKISSLAVSGSGYVILSINTAGTADTAITFDAAFDFEAETDAGIMQLPLAYVRVDSSGDTPVIAEVQQLQYDIPLLAVLNAYDGYFAVVDNFDNTVSVFSGEVRIDVFYPVDSDSFAVSASGYVILDIDATTGSLVNTLSFAADLTFEPVLNHIQIPLAYIEHGAKTLRDGSAGTGIILIQQLQYGPVTLDLLKFPALITDYDADKILLMVCDHGVYKWIEAGSCDASPGA